MLQIFFTRKDKSAQNLAVQGCIKWAHLHGPISWARCLPSRKFSRWARSPTANLCLPTWPLVEGPGERSGKEEIKSPNSNVSKPSSKDKEDMARETGVFRMEKSRPEEDHRCHLQIFEGMPFGGVWFPPAVQNSSRVSVGCREITSLQCPTILFLRRWTYSIP